MCTNANRVRLSTIIITVIVLVVTQIKHHGDRYDGIAKSSICIGQRPVWIFRGIASQLGNDDFCSHGPSFLFFLSFFLFLLRTSEHLCQRSYEFSRHSFNNTLQQTTHVCHKKKPEYHHMSNHTYAKWHGGGNLLVNTFLSGYCIFLSYP